MRARREALAAVALLLGAALYFVLVELHRPALPALDVYDYFLPNKLHAVYSFLHGGKGLLWNPYQSCGEPFFANTAMSLLYPPHLLFLVLEPNLAVHVVLILNMVLGATGMLLLARELGLDWVAALGGALVFELGDPMAQLTGWSPMQNGPWAWLPWALLLCERLLRAPSRRAVVGLAAVLALELLPGWVLIAALTYQLIALRVVWELVTRRTARPWRAVGAIAAGLALAPLLAAVQLVPAAELTGESYRLAVEVNEFRQAGMSLTDVLAAIGKRTPPVPFTVTVLVLAGAAPLVSANRRLAAFYLLTGALYGVLALGASTRLFSLYARLPPGAVTLRAPHRLFWISAFCLTILTAFCLDALKDRVDRPASRWLAAIVALMVGAGLHAFTPGGLRWTEAIALTAVVAAVCAATVRPALGRPAAWVIVGAIALNLVAVPLRYLGSLTPSAEPLWRHAATFSALDPPITAQDRVYLFPALSSLLTFAQKTATVMRVPDFYDYEALLGRRFSDYVATVWQGAPFTSLENLRGPPVMGSARRRLLDLASVRYVIAAPSINITDRGLDLPRTAVSSTGLDVYLSDTAFPRARYVPHIEVVQDPSALINRLAYGSDDLAEVAFVEEALPSGFTGVAGSRRAGATRFVTNDPEHLVIDVDAPAPGFLLLADQYYPGWRATVNGAAVPIQRANYMFRLIEVPAGTSRVEFRYRPTSVAIGAVISAMTVGVLAVLLWRGSGRSSCRHAAPQSVD